LTQERKISSKINRFHKIQNNNAACFEKLSADGGGTMEEFSKCSLQELTAFIHIRGFESLNETAKFPKKGKLEGAKAGEDNLIKRAFDCRNNPLILKMPKAAVVVDKTVCTDTRHQEATVIRLDSMGATFSSSTKASEWLQDKSWVDEFYEAADPTSGAKREPVTDELCERADTLQKMLVRRMIRDCSMRYADERKWEHWSLKYTARNMPQVAATMVLNNHIKKDLSCLDTNACLLAETTNFLKAQFNDEQHLEGCYLYYDCNNRKWIRSGKAVGSTMCVRHGQHEKESHLKTASSLKSKFYNSYPSKDVVLPSEQARLGKFENLQQHVGIGYNRTRKGNLLKDVKVI